jgi:hypothetical protein
MQKILLISLAVFLFSTTAEARWWHHHHHGHAYYYGYVGRWDNGYPHVRVPKAPAEMASDESAQESRVPGGTPSEGQPSTADGNTTALWLPPDWQRQPADPNWQGERFLSPDGTASFSANITPVGQEPIAQHMRAVAFGDGEQITRLRGGRSWIEVSGFKGDRIFYRKSVLACGGTSWHEVAFEYPAEIQGMNLFVDRAASGVESNQDKGCAPAVASSNGEANGGGQSRTDNNSGAQ